MRRTASSGFTLVELLVVIALIGILVALLLPAVQAAREAARQVQCRNNIKQIALACHNYESTQQVLPGYAGEQHMSLVTYTVQRRAAAMRGWNWIAKAMPFMEQEALARQWGPVGSKRGALTAADLRGIDTALSVFHCPTRRTAQAYPLVGTFKPRFGDFAARTDYAMNGGNGTVDSQNIWVHLKDDGVWRVGKMTRFSDIKDGLSNTYLIGEKAMNQHKYHTGTDFGDRSPASGWVDNARAANSFVRLAARAPVRDHRANCNACHDFGSAHAASWNAALADGSVRTISYSIDMALYRASASIEGGENSAIND